MELAHPKDKELKKKKNHPHKAYPGGDPFSLD